MSNNIENKLIVDGQEVTFSDEKNLLEVIRKAGIEVPSLCYRPELSTFGACRMCVVDIEGMGIQASCTIKPTAGMKVRVNTEQTRKIRKMNLELLLANHERDCTTCAKSDNCDLQELAKKLGVTEVRFGTREKVLPIDYSNPSIVRDPNKCILCGACVRACREIQGVDCLNFVNRGSDSTVMPAFGKSLSDVDCTYCGQCLAVCPTGALRIKSDTEKVWDKIVDDKQKVVVQVAPAVRVAVGEAFGFKTGEDTIGLITAALRKIGFDKVYDTSFTADLTIMEEGTEFIKRFTEGKNLPIFTSCCPAWVRYAEQHYPEMLDNLSTCKSPQQMFGSVIRKLVPTELNIPTEDLTVVSIMPCTAKKAEVQRPEFAIDGVKDVDFALTSQELIDMIKEAGIDFNNLQSELSDSPFGDYTGAGVIFGATGGVAEAALRTAYEIITGKPLENIDIKAARGFDTLKELTVDIEGQEVKVAVVNTLSEASRVVEKIKSGEATYHIVEVMACPGGCLAGAGQPQSYMDKAIKENRMKGLYQADVDNKLRKSHENPEITKLYETWLETPNSKISHEFLHTHYNSRKKSLEELIPKS